MKPHRFVCTICFCRCTGWGHNADPINDGRCCDSCSELVVIPVRIALRRAMPAIGHSQTSERL
jgi:hypothetical protein